jgi:hypothetical protein
MAEGSRSYPRPVDPTVDRMRGGGNHGNEPPYGPSMDLLAYRMSQFEKHAEAADARMARIEDRLVSVQVSIAALATKDSIRNWGLAIIAIVMAAGLAVGAILLQASGNQLAAFQSGLSAVQSVVSGNQAAPLQSPALRR